MTDFYFNRKANRHYKNCKSCHNEQTKKDRLIRKDNGTYKKQNQNEYHHNRYQTNDNARISQNIRDKLNYYVKGLKIKNEEKYKNFIGCDSITFVKWLQFTKDYYIPIDYEGKPQIDHFYCLSHFNLSDINDYKLANHWTNLRYITAEENFKKSKRIPTPDEIFKHDVIKKMFLESLENEEDEVVISEVAEEVEEVRESSDSAISEVASEFEYITLDDSEIEKEFEKEQEILSLKNEH